MKILREKDDDTSVLVSCAILRGACRAAITSKGYPNGKHIELYHALLEYYDHQHDRIVAVKEGCEKIGAGDFRKQEKSSDDMGTD